MKNKELRRLLAGLLSLMLALSLCLPAAVYAEAADTEDAQEADAAEETQTSEKETVETRGEEILHIASTEEFLEFAENCTLDTWSQGKRFVLDCDINLEGTDFTPVPTFGGTFVGGGYTIRGLNLTQSVSPAGLFAVLQPGGAIRNLNVEGTVSPDGDTGSVGGIVGENYGAVTGCSFTGAVSGTHNVGGIAGTNEACGVIRSCRTSGALFGENRTGGVAGSNQGLIASCRNNMYINIESTDPSIDLSNVNLDFSLDLEHLKQMDTANVATDTGGIAGYSSGTILSCINLASIGHEHIGYNVGGIAGRSCGQIRDCSNEGGVCGRKDVGGIAGQIEPYIQMQLSETAMSQVETQLNELNDLVNKAADNAESSAGGVTSRLNGISGYVNSAMQEAENIKLTAGIDTSVKGSGSHDSQTSIDHDASLSLPTSAEDLLDGIGASSETWIDHTGDASGILDATTQIVAAPDLGGLTSAVSGIGSQLSLLNGAISGAVGMVADDVRAINAKFGELSDTIFDAISEAQQGVSSVVTDVSEVDVENITFGKTYDCQNSGTVYGDINTGGVAGAMAIEYSLDPEDDVSSDLSDNYRRQYEYRAVIQNCVNTGSVSSKRSYVGGICGRMDLGLITGCEGYGVIRSESANYVGGIAGMTAATIRSSYAKASLEGQKYVGGIVGSGVQEDVSGSGSTVAGCYSLVEVTGCKQYSGAISGADAGSFLENYYVSDTLAGVNRRSYSGQAEPVTFEELTQIEGLPEAMHEFTLRFVADEQEIFSTEFSYGDSFDAADFPSIPEKEGCIAGWDKTELDTLHFDTTVTAVYTPYTPAVASASTREDGRAILLVEGDFRETDEMTVTSEPLTPSAFHIHSGGLGNRIESYFSTVGTSDFSLITMNWDDVEQWSVQAPHDGAKTHNLRYLPPSGEKNRLKIYTENNGVWEKTDYETVGSYLVFPFEGESVRVAVVTTIEIWWVWVLALAVLAGLVLLVIHLVHKMVRRAKAPAQPQKVDSGAAEDAVENAAEQQPAQPDPELLARAVSAEERLARAEEELRALRESSASGGGTAVETKPKKKFRWWLPVVIVLGLLAAGAAVFFLRSGMREGLEAYRMLKSCNEKDPLSMTLDISASIGGEELRTEAAVCRTKLEGTEITCVERDGVKLYYANGVVYLENGRAYSVGTLYPDYGRLVSEAADLYRLVDVKTSASGGSKVYTLTADGKDAAAIAAILLPDDSASQLQSLEVRAEASGGKIASLYFAASSGSLSLDAQAKIVDGGKVPAIPEEVRSAVLTGKSAGSDTMSGDVFRLLQAWAALNEKSTCSADLALSADCGPIVVSETLRYDRQKVSGQNIGCVRKSAAAVYFSDDRICDENGRSITTDSKTLVDSAKLLDLAYQLMLNGTVGCAETQSGYVYSLDLDEDGMREIAYAIAPDVKSQSLSLTAGRIEAVVEDGEITSLSLTCSGSIHIVVADADASLGAKITFADREVSMPQAVVNALKK